jgi:hypothetical protein
VGADLPTAFTPCTLAAETYDPRAADDPPFNPKQETGERHGCGSAGA